MIIKTILFFILLNIIFLKTPKTLRILQQTKYNQNNNYLKYSLLNYQDIFNKTNIIMLISLIVGCIFTNLLGTFSLLITILLGILIIERIRYQLTIEKIKYPLVINNQTRVIVIFFSLLILLLIISYIFLPQYTNYLLIITYLFYFLNFIIIYILNLINIPLKRIALITMYLLAYKKIKKVSSAKRILIIGNNKEHTLYILKQILKEDYSLTCINYNYEEELYFKINKELHLNDDYIITNLNNNINYKRLIKMFNPTYIIINDLLNSNCNIQNILNQYQKTVIIDIKSYNSYKKKLKNKKNIITYGLKNKEATINGKDYYLDFNKSNLKVSINNQILSIETKLLGKNNLLNIIAVIAVCYQLKMDYNILIKQLNNLSPEPHNLNNYQKSNYYLLDDTKNNNIHLVNNSLEVLNKFKGMKIIVTPGFINAKKKEYTYISKNIASVVDYVILIGENQTKIIYQELIKNNFNKDHILITNDLYESYKLVASLSSGFNTCALYENDLLDIYSEKTKIK